MATNAETTLRRNLKNIEAQLTELFREEIIRQELIDTGLMLRTTRAFLIEAPRGFEINVESTDYFEYIDAKFQVTENVLKSRGFELLLEEIGNYYAEFTANKIEEDLK